MRSNIHIFVSSIGLGFVIPENVRMQLQGDTSFLGRIFGFTPFDAVPLEIANEDAIGK
jgi:hypothetical protein